MLVGSPNFPGCGDVISLVASSVSLIYNSKQMLV